MKTVVCSRCFTSVLAHSCTCMGEIQFLDHFQEYLKPNSAENKTKYMATSVPYWSKCPNAIHHNIILGSSPYHTPAPIARSHPGPSFGQDVVGASHGQSTCTTIGVDHLDVVIQHQGLVNHSGSPKAVPKMIKHGQIPGMPYPTTCFKLGYWVVYFGVQLRLLLWA